MNPIQASPTIGSNLKVFGTTFSFLATELQTEGAYSMMELLIPPGEGMLAHRHQLETKLLHVLEGQLTVRLEEELHTLGASQSLFIPRSALHAYQSTGGVPAKAMIVVSPGFLYEKFLAEVGQTTDIHDKFLAELGLRDTAPKAPVNLEALAQVAAKYQIEVLFE